MAKTVTRPIKVRDKDNNAVWLQPGQEVPSGVDVPDEYTKGHEPEATAGGMDLATDHTWNELCRAADRVGLEYKKSWSKEQIAQALRHYLFAEDVERNFEDYEYDQNAMAEVNDARNAAGNVTAPDSESKSEAKRSGTAKEPTKSESRAGGSNS